MDMLVLGQTHVLVEMLVGLCETETTALVGLTLSRCEVLALRDTLAHLSNVTPLVIVN